MLPSERYLRGGAWPPVMRASWGVSVCCSGDRQGWAPLKLKGWGRSPGVLKTWPVVEISGDWRGREEWEYPISRSP